MLGLVRLCHTDTFIYAGRPSCMYEAWSLTWLKIITGLFLYVFPRLPIRSVKSKGLIKFRGFSAQRQIRGKNCIFGRLPIRPVAIKPKKFHQGFFRPDAVMLWQICIFGWLPVRPVAVKWKNFLQGFFGPMQKIAFSVCCPFGPFIEKINFYMQRFSARWPNIM